MNALITSTASCPTSFQLKFAFNRQKSPSVFLRSRFSELDRRRVNLVWLVVRSSGVNGLGRRRIRVSSWMNSNSSSEDFSGWANADGDMQPDNSRRKTSLFGILRAGAAGILLVVGLTFTAFSINNRTTSRVKQQMEPVTSQQEESLSSDNHHDSFGEEKNGEKVEILQSDSEESKTGTNKDLLLHKENSEANESSNSDDVGARQSSEVVDLTNIHSDEKVAQEGSARTGVLVSGEADDSVGVQSIQTENESPANENTYEPKAEGHVDGSLAAESTSAPESDNHVDDKILVPSELDSRPENVTADYPDGLSSSVESRVDDFIELDTVPEEYEESINLPTSGDVEMGNKPLTVDADSGKILEVSVDGGDKYLESMNGIGSDGVSLVPEITNQFGNELHEIDYDDINVNRYFFDSTNPGNFFTSAGIPAPSVVSAALQAPPGKVLVPAVVDQLQTLALSALKDLKVIEDDVQPGDICTRREYARWLVAATSILSRSTTSKVYPAMYIEKISELAFDDITPDDPDFPSIQGLAEAGLIASKLSRHDVQSSVDEDPNPSPLFFSPESPLSRQDLVSWKLALENRQLPVVDRKTLQLLSGFIDIDKIDQDAWPALAADIAAGEQGIITLAFGYTRLFQPGKPVTKAQAAMALSTGDAATVVSDELARIEAESMAENAVAAHNALIAQVEKDLNASYEKELLQEKEKIDAFQKLAEEARREVELLRAEREERNLALMKERAAVDSEMEILSRLRREVDEQLQTLSSDKVEISYEKERLSKLRRDAETENQEISRLQYELEVERKALSMARAWAEDEMKRAREQAKALEEARNRWESQGIKVVVDNDLREEEDAGVTWLDTGKQFSAEGTIERSENLVDKLRTMAAQVSGKCKSTINKIIEQIYSLISILKEKALKIGNRAGELKNTAKSNMNVSLQGMQRGSAEFASSVSEGAKRVAGDWKDGVERLSQKFKA